MTKIECDVRVWIDRLIEISRGSDFTASERAFVTQRLLELRADLGKPIPFVEGR
jgi:hypothetical protein